MSLVGCIAINKKSGVIMLTTILIVLLVLLLIGAFPSWRYSAGWGYYPFSGLMLVLIIIIILALLGKI